MILAETKLYTEFGNGRLGLRREGNIFIIGCYAAYCAQLLKWFGYFERFLIPVDYAKI